METILFVAVSQSIADIAKRVISEMGVKIPVVISSEAEIPELLRKYPDIEVFISRGRPALVLQQLSGRPTIFLTSSMRDILEPVQKLIDRGSKKIAVMASPLLMGEGNYSLNVGEVDILMQPYETGDLERVFNDLKKFNVEGIVAGARAYKEADKYGTKAELLETGESSIKQALKDAINIAKAQENKRLQDRQWTEDIERCSRELYTALEQAYATVQELSSSSEELAVTSQETANIVKNTFNEMNSTSMILEVIRRVAKQTNLLGLNAAIEASRAGEYGRGFLVVASEVRKLADESSSSAHNIDNMLKRFRNSVEEVLNNVQQSNLITQEQAKANGSIVELLDNLRDICGNLVKKMQR